MHESRSLTRRNFIKGSAAVAGAALAGSHVTSSVAEASTAAQDKESLVIDCHAHLAHHSASNYLEKDQKLIEAADKLGIDQLCCSILTPRRPATAEGFKECNVWAAEAVRRFPDHLLAYCYVNPTHSKEALADIRHCVEDCGFMGIKLYNEELCTNEIVFPIVELAIELRVPILHHAGHSHYFNERQPYISDGGHLAELGARYPEARLICAHVGGGGDWEWTIKALRHAPPNVFLDTSGSVIDEGMIEMAVRDLGPKRVLFGCDMSMTPGVGKMRGANLAPKDKRQIMGLNMKQILDLRGKK
jgi:uncharacterized protein